jgi:thiol-disulfide isomerase/thioredoxin
MMLVTLLALILATPPAPMAATPEQLLAAIKDSNAKVTVVNIWATWCIPCREEFPDLLKLRRTYKDRGVAVLFVSGDFGSERQAVVDFLAEQGVDFPTYLKTGDDMQFINAFDPKWSGTLPATFIYDAHGERRAALHGKSSYAQFEAKVLDVLKGD